MKKKVGTTRKNRRRPAVKDLTAAKSRNVKGAVDHSEFHIVKLVDKATPKLYETGG
jgi:type VI protein secretion system component Hcp